MKRQIIHIDQEKCNGCGACAAACHEGAIAMVGGKATLMRDDYCDGMGDCLPHCPTGAITFEQREAAPYNEAAVQAAKAHKAAHAPHSCPGSAPKTMHVCPGSMAKALHPADAAGESTAPTMAPSQLRQWPVQIRLVPINDIAEIADKMTRNEIMTSNEFRQAIGMKPSKDPKADELRNANISQSSEVIAAQNKTITAGRDAVERSIANQNG